MVLSNDTSSSSHRRSDLIGMPGLFSGSYRTRTHDNSDAYYDEFLPSLSHYQLVFEQMKQADPTSSPGALHFKTMGELQSRLQAREKHIERKVIRTYSRKNSFQPLRSELDSSFTSKDSINARFSMSSLFTNDSLDLTETRAH